MLKQFGCLLLIGLLTVQSLWGQERPIGEWQVYLPYKRFSTLTLAEDKLYIGTDDSFICTYDLEDQSIQTYSNLNDFAEPEVEQIAYDPAQATLCIAYQNSNIDLLKDGRLINMPEIKNKTIIGDKNIYDIHFIDSLVYLACGFGIVVLDSEKEEVKDTYYIGPQGDRIKVYSVTDDGQTLMAATELGVFSADLSNPNLINFNNWYQHDITDGLPSETPATAIAFFDSHFFAAVGSQLYRWDNEMWTSVYETTPLSFEGDWTIIKARASENHLVLTENLISSSDSLMTDELGKVVVLDKSLNATTYDGYYFKRVKEAIFYEASGEVWAVDEWRSIVRVRDGEISSSFSVNGPQTIGAWKLAIENQNLWVAPATITGSWGKGTDRSGFFKLENGNWNSIKPDPAVKDIVDIAFDPNSNKTYLASYNDGLLVFENGSFTNTFTPDNSSLLSTSGDPTSIRISGLTFDQQSNLWVANYGAVRPISVMTPNGDWANFALTNTTGVTDVHDWVTEMVVDPFNNIWAVVRGTGIYVFNTGEDVLDPSDDQSRFFQKIDFNNGIPNNAANCVVIDKEEEVWVGTEEGIAIFYCTSDPFNENCEFSKPIVQLEGENEPVFVLDGTSISTIAVDPADRKWIGTNQGVLLLSPDGKETIQQFNVENSPLLSNNIQDIEVNAQTGVVYIATDKGICSYQSDALDGGDGMNDVVVYPNPVRPDYIGNIAIRGLVDNANVKITDISGQLIYETTALGGQAIWDGNNYNGVRAKTGVYVVLCASPDGSQTVSTKLFLVN